LCPPPPPPPFFLPAGASWSRCWTGTRWTWWCRDTCTRTGALPDVRYRRRCHCRRTR
jgi:hypothetical protein